jgi:hypothetical protein
MRRALLWVISAASLAGCPGPSGPEPGEACAFFGVDAGPPETRTIEAGEGRGASFVPWTDGGAAELVAGGQGGFMITPTFRLAAGASVEPEICVHVAVLNGIAGFGDLEEGATADLLFARDGDAYYGGPMFDLLTGNPDVRGRVLMMRTAVSAPAIAGVQLLSVTLR